MGAAPAFAETPPDPPAQFFTSIQDMPLMPGLVELTDQTVMFDKPEGRIIESVAEIESASQPEISRYYETALPQLGWSRVAADSYVREGESLKISFETLKGHRFFRVIVAPRETDSDAAL
jgi:hypothetical protein